MKRIADQELTLLRKSAWSDTPEHDELLANALDELAAFRAILALPLPVGRDEPRVCGGHIEANWLTLRVHLYEHRALAAAVIRVCMKHCIVPEADDVDCEVQTLPTIAELKLALEEACAIASRKPSTRKKTNAARKKRIAELRRLAVGSMP